MNSALAAVVASLALTPLGCSRPDATEQDRPPVASEGPRSPAVAPESPSARVSPPIAKDAIGTGPLHFVAIGGGPTPESTEVSLEQDIALVQRALPGPGIVLFAGGSSSSSVRELDPAEAADAVKMALGDLFAPRAGRQSRYRRPSFGAERATLDNVRGRLSTALQHGKEPLLVYVAAHGDQGSDPKSNTIALWGGHALSVAELAELHERHRRPLRLVATSCFSGGFAELAFARADATSRRPAPVTRCGLFAGTADRETSGCDPNPNRRAQESYGLHFAHALAGARRDGTPLAPGVADYDRDGRIGMLDAHTWARIEALSFDVPTTTSERWLRSAESGEAPIDPRLLPEEHAVVARLGAALGLADEAAVAKRWSELDRQLRELETAIDAAEDAVSERAADEATLLLERWPVLDDPFHPLFESTFRDNRAAIEIALTASPEARERSAASERAQALYARLDRLGVQEARVFRLLRAYETLHKASALAKKGGPAERYYRALLDCERGAP